METKEKKQLDDKHGQCDSSLKTAAKPNNGKAECSSKEEAKDTKFDKKKDKSSCSK